MKTEHAADNPARYCPQHLSRRAADRKREATEHAADSEGVQAAKQEIIEAEKRFKAADKAQEFNLNDILDKALNMIASGINHTLSPDDEEYVRGQIDWALRQSVWKQIRAADKAHTEKLAQALREIRELNRNRGRCISSNTLWKSQRHE